MEIKETKEGTAAVLHIAGRLDSNTSQDFEEKLFDTIQNRTLRIVLNFEALAYISSAGLRVILKAAKDLKRRDGRLILCAMQDYVREVFEISGFDTFLSIVPTVEDAISAL